MSHEEWQPTMTHYGIQEDAEWAKMKQDCWDNNKLPFIAIEEANTIAVAAINKAMGK